MADLIKEQLKTGFTKVENNSFFSPLFPVALFLSRDRVGDKEEKGRERESSVKGSQQWPQHLAGC